MRRNTYAMLFVAAVAAVSMPLVPAQAEPLQSAELAARVDDGFDFRGRTMIWHFTPDGKVTGNSTASRLTLGGMGETFGIVNNGTWRRTNDRLCITWQQPKPLAEACYTVTVGADGMTLLSGPDMMTGKLEGSGPNENVAPAAPPSRPGVAIPSIPGAR